MLRRLVLGALVWLAACSPLDPLPAAETGPFAETGMPRLLWSRALETSFARAPQGVGETVYLAAKDGRVIALSAENGGLIWEAQFEGRLWDLSFVATEAAIYLGAQGGRLLSLDPSDGSPRWERTLGIEVTFPPVASGSVVLVPTAFVGTDIEADFQGRAVLFALDADSGETLWQFTSGSYLLSSPVPDPGEGVVYAAGPYLPDTEDDEEGGHTRLYALRLDDGGLVWEAEVAAGLPKNLTLDSGVLGLMGYRDALIAVDARDGRLLWEFDTGNWVESFSTANGLTFFGSATSTVFAVAVETGREEWRHQLEGMFNYIIGGPDLEGGRLYFITTHSQIVALDAATGQEIWSMETEILARAPLVVDEGRLFVAAADGRVYAYAVP